MDKHIVKKMHQRCHQTILLLEDCICNGGLVLSAKLKQEAPIAITAVNAVAIKDYFLGHLVAPRLQVPGPCHLQLFCKNDCANLNRMRIEFLH